MASAFVAAAAPSASSVFVGGAHSSCQLLIATPHQAIAQPGSALATAVNSLIDSRYQNECNVQTAWRKAGCTAGWQDVAKSTSSTGFAVVSARTAGWPASAKSAAPARTTPIRQRVMTKSSQKQSAGVIGRPLAAFDFRDRACGSPLVFVRVRIDAPKRRKMLYGQLSSFLR